MSFVFTGTAQGRVSDNRYAPDPDQVELDDLARLVEGLVVGTAYLVVPALGLHVFSLDDSVGVDIALKLVKGGNKCLAKN